MRRLIWILLPCVLGAVLVVGGSWAFAYNRVATLLGSPPPSMGSRSTKFLWDGARQVRGHPKVWSFVFGPTRIPGAPNVRVYVTPTGRVVFTEPGDLAVRIKAFHSIGY